MSEDRISFIQWLINRLLYKHHYTANDATIEALSNLKDYLSKQLIVDIDNSILDTIISKYYVDFNLDKTEDLSFGFSDEERQNLRQIIRKITSDIIGTINKG